MMRDRRHEEIDEFEPIDFQPLVFANEGAAIGPMDRLVGPAIDVHERKGRSRGPNDCEGGFERSTGAGAEPEETGAQKRELAKNVRVVDVLEAGKEGDADGPPESSRAKFEAGFDRRPLPDEQKERDVPDGGDGDVVG
jgi:hypothetical protein